MKIDLFTLIAQAINFLVLVALLRRFLYGPVVRAMDRREQELAGRLTSAEEREAEAERLTERHAQQLRELDERREELLREARHDASEARERLLRENHAFVEQRREEWLAALAREQDELLGAVRVDAGRLAIDATRRTLDELAGVTLEQAMAERFAEQLGRLGESERREASEHLNVRPAVALIRSAFPLTNLSQERLRLAVREAFPDAERVEFERTPELICGVELEVGGYRCAWSTADMLHDLERSFLDRLAASRPT